MKKRILQLTAVFIMLFGFLSAAEAVSFSGEYMFTVSGNDTLATMISIEGQAEDWFLNVKNIVRTVDFEFYQKVDEPDTSASPPGMTVTYYSGNLAGEWTTDDPVEFYTVKAATEFALYWLEGGANSGFWSTEHLQNPGGNQPEISHLSAWNTVDTPPPNPVPEPSTIFLLGLGLIGLAQMGRKTLTK